MKEKEGRGSCGEGHRVPEEQVSVSNAWAPGSDWVAQLVRVLSQYSKVVGSIPSQRTHKNKPMNA